MPILIRMPDALDAQVREKAQSLGISINALLCVAVDSYLRGGIQAIQDRPPQSAPVVAQAAQKSAPQPAPVPVHTHTRKQRRELDRMERRARK